MPVIVLRESAKTIQDVARDLIAIIDADDTATTLVAFDPTLGPNVAALLGQALGEPTPDHLPGWVDGCSDGDGATWSGLDFTPSQLRDLLAEADVPLQLQFRDFTEPLRADRLAPGLYRLRCFSDFVPLATGDIVTVEEDTMAVTGWHQLEDTWIVRAFFDLSVEESRQQAKADQWASAATVQYSGTQTALVACTNRDWIDKHVASDPMVNMVNLVRAAGSTFDLAAAVRDLR